MIIAYLRVSTGQQHLNNQREEVLRFASRKQLNVDQWVTEIVSGSKHRNDSKLGYLLNRMKKGDTLIVTEISRLSRTLTDIMEIMGRCLRKDIRLYSIKEGHEFDNSINSKVLCFAFGLVAEIERNLISMRTREALALRKAQGVKLGRRKGSSPKMQILEKYCSIIVKKLEEGTPIYKVCKEYGVSRDTFNRFRQQHPDIGLPENRRIHN